MKIIFFVASLFCLNATASLSDVQPDAQDLVNQQAVNSSAATVITAELINEEDLVGEEIVDEVTIVTSEDEEQQSEVVYVDENGDEYIVISEDYASEGKATVRLKKKKGGKGRNCVAQDGGASWYGPGFNGNRTANGERFNQNDMTAAHKTIKFNSLVRVTYQGRSVVVRINDAGPFVRGRVIDLSKAAAQELGLIAAGHGKVKLEILRCGAEEVVEEEQPATTDEAQADEKKAD
jgi:rare lipoprotein A (peptidoglycan hydrolase)